VFSTKPGRLKSIGCDFAQGFLFAPALPADAFEAMLQAQTAGGGVTGGDWKMSSE